MVLGNETKRTVCDLDQREIPLVSVELIRLDLTRCHCLTRTFRPRKLCLRKQGTNKDVEAIMLVKDIKTHFGMDRKHSVICCCFIRIHLAACHMTGTFLDELERQQIFPITVRPRV